MRRTSEGGVWAHFILAGIKLYIHAKFSVAMCCPGLALRLTLFLSLHSPDPVEVGQEAKVRVDLLPLHVGRHKLVVDFESDKLKAVKGYRNVIIGPP